MTTQDELASSAIDNAIVVAAPDGSEVRILVSGEQGSMAQFRLAPGQVSLAVRHRSVEELWFVTQGLGEMWRKAESGMEDVTALYPGQSLRIAVGTSFQFRCTGEEPLHILGVTMPPWPGADEAAFVPGKW